MPEITRRRFVQTGAVAAGAAGAALVLPGSWLGFVSANGKGYFETQFGVTEALCRKLLDQALSKGGDIADLYFEHTISNWLTLEDGQVNRAYGDVDLGVGIRTVKGDQVGFAFTQDLTEQSMLAAASVAATIADSKAAKCQPQFVPPRMGDYYPIGSLFTAVPVSSKLPVVQSVNDKCFAKSKLVSKSPWLVQPELGRRPSPTCCCASSSQSAGRCGSMNAHCRLSPRLPGGSSLPGCPSAQPSSTIPWRITCAWHARVPATGRCGLQPNKPALPSGSIPFPWAARPSSASRGRA